MGFLHIDAHADLRQAYEGFTFSHASILYNLLQEDQVGPIVQVGIRDQCEEERQRALADPRVTQSLDAELAMAMAGGETWRDLMTEALKPLPQRVWITFDVDGLQPSLCPNTGTPVPGGLSWSQACVLLHLLGRSGRTIVGFDLCEVGAHTWDANVGARLLYKLAGWALLTSEQR